MKYMRRVFHQASTKVNKVYIARHGESIWNHDSKFTGWTDIPLTENGRVEAKVISHTLLHHQIQPSVLFSSVLERAINTSNIIKNHMEKETSKILPMHTSWRLNEKHYGTLEGIPRQYIRDEYGDKFTQMMRNNFYMKPPVLPHLPIQTDYPIYENCYYESVKNGESKENVLERLLPYFENDVLYMLKKDNIPLIITHKHCARVLMKHLLSMTDEDFEDYTIPSNHILELEFDDSRKLKKSNFIQYVQPPCSGS